MTPDILIFGLLGSSLIVKSWIMTGRPAASVLWEAVDISNLGPISNQLFILVSHGAG